MILLTGASGFLGQHLTRLLSARGLTVRALYHTHPPTGDLRALPGITWTRCDLLDIFDVQEAFEDITEVYHCAAIVSFHAADAERMLQANAESTANVVNEAILHSVRKLVHISSVAAIGRDGDASKVITEEENWDESTYGSAYGMSKHLAELEVWRGIGEGLNAAVLNPGIILGPGNWDEGSAQIIRLADREFPFYTTGVNGWVDVRDVADIAYRLMQSDISAERFIVSAGNYTYREIFTHMAGRLGKKPPHIAAGSMLTGLTWRAYILRALVTGKRSLVTRETAHTASAIVNYNNQKLLRALPGFQYRDIVETVNHMADAYVAGI